MDFPIYNSGSAVTPTHASSQLLISGSTHTKLAWVGFITSTSRDASGIWVSLSNGNAANHSYMVDIAVGASGSEVVIASNILLSQVSGVAATIFIPVDIPAGTRIAARAQGNTLGTACWLRVTLFTSGFWGNPPGGKIVTLGANTGTTRGTSLTGNNGSFGSWAQITAATSDDICAIWVLTGNGLNTAPVSGQVNENAVDIGVGAAASENSVAGPVPVVTNTTGMMIPTIKAWIPCSIPSGSRVAARYQTNNTNATDRLIDVVVYGLVI